MIIIYTFLAVSYFQFKLAAQETKIIDKSTYRVIYDYKFQKDSTSFVYKDRLELLIGKKYSLFQSLNTKFNDSLFNANEDAIHSATESSEISSILSEQKRAVLKLKILKKGKHITTYDKVMVDRYVYDETINFNWKIHKDTLTINSYKCNKATIRFSGRDYIAWFAKEIPIANGPYKFAGLPGLIIKIYDTKKQHTFALESFVKKQEPIILYKDIFSSGGPRQKVSKKEYYKAIKDFKDNPISYRINKMGQIFDENNRQEQYRQILERTKRYKANTIEQIIE